MKIVGIGIIASMIGIAVMLLGFGMQGTFADPIPQLTPLSHIAPTIKKYSDITGLNVNGQELVFAGTFQEQGPLHVYDYTDPVNPVIVPNSLPEFYTLDLYALNGDTIILGDEYTGARAISFADPLNPVILGHVDGSILPRLHNLTVCGSRMYWTANATNEINVVEWAVPTVPVVLPSLFMPDVALPWGGTTPQRIHGLDCKNGLLAAAGAFQYPVVNLIDITVDPPVVLSTFPTAFHTAHSAVFSDDLHWVVINMEESDGQPQIFDISMPGSPVFVDTIAEFGEGSCSVHDGMWNADLLTLSWACAGIFQFNMAITENVFPIPWTITPTLIGGYNTAQNGGVGLTDFASGAWDSWQSSVDPDAIFVSDMQTGIWAITSGTVPDPTPTPPPPTATPTPHPGLNLPICGDVPPYDVGPPGCTESDPDHFGYSRAE